MVAINRKVWTDGWMRPWNHRQKHFRCHRFWMEPVYQHRARRKCMASWTWSQRNISPHICTRQARCECRIIVPSSLVYRQVSIWIKSRTKVARKTICWMVWKIDGKNIPTGQSKAFKCIFFFSWFSFSDPCLAANSDDDESAQASRQNKTNTKNPLDSTKLLSTLIQQINILHDTNSKICRNLNDTKG